VPPGEQVTIIELGGTDRSMAYVFWEGEQGDGVYGWVERARLTGQPNGDVEYTVRAVPAEQLPGATFQPDPDARLRQGTVAGKDLLMIPEVLGMFTPDDHTLILETWGPVPHMIDLSANRALRPTPREVVSRWPKRWTEPDKIVTSGPFHLTGWYERDRMEFEKSDTYWKKDEVKLERFTSYNMNDQAASANYYMTGGCDAIASNNVPSSYLPVLNGDKRGGRSYKDYHSAPYMGIYMYLINTKKYPNVHFRRALNLAIDRRPIPDIIHGGQLPTAQFMPGLPVDLLSPEERALCGVHEGDEGVALIVQKNKYCYRPPAGPDFDLEAAKKELAIARKEMGAKFPDRFTVKFNTGIEGHKLIAEYLQYEWKEKLGLDVQLESQEWKTFLKDTINGQYDVARMGWIGEYPDPEEFLKIFKCESPNNRTQFCNDEFENLFKQIESESDRTRRLQLVYQAEKVMIDHAPVIPLYVYTQQHLRKPYVRDLAINFPDDLPIYRAWIDPDWKSSQQEAH
jgi:oligopeptide transport system substrate-binding protein